MKRLLLIWIVLMLSMSVAFSESPGSPFIDSLEEAISLSGPEENRYQVDVSLGGQDYSAGLQYDGDSGTTEINLEQLGLIQLDPEKAVYLAAGTPFVLNYSQFPGLAELIESPRKWVDTRLSIILGKAIEYLVNPFVQYEFTPDCIAIHFDIDTVELRTQIASLISDLIQDETVKAFYPAVARLLQNGGIWLPDTIEELPKLIASVIPYGNAKQGRLTGDLMITMDHGCVSCVVFSGHYHYRYNGYSGSYPLYFELSIMDGKTDVYLDADTPSGGITFSLQGNQFRFETRDSQYENARGPVMISAEGTYDRANGEVNGVISDKYEKEAGRISGIILHDKLSMNVQYYKDNIHIYLKNGGKYIYGNVGIKSSAYSGDYELWLEETPEHRYRASLHVNNPFSRTDDFFALQFGSSGIALQYFQDGEEILSASGYYDSYTRGIDLSGKLKEYGNIYQVHLYGAGEDYQLEFGYPYDGWLVEGKGSIRLSPQYLLQSAVCDVNMSDYDYWDESYSVIDTMTYTIERTEDTAEKMVYRLRKDSDELFRLELGLKKDELSRTFTLLALQGEEPVFSASVLAEPKKPIIPIDTTNAVDVTPAVLGVLLMSLIP